VWQESCDSIATRQLQLPVELNRCGDSYSCSLKPDSYVRHLFLFLSLEQSKSSTEDTKQQTTKHILTVGLSLLIRTGQATIGAYSLEAQ
jgi:hypothetical protein